MTVSDEQPNKGGRPPGKENAVTLLDRELRQTIKTMTNMRVMVEHQISVCIKQLSKPDVPISARLETINQLSTIMTGLAKNVETLSKYTLGQAKQRDRKDDDEQPIKSSMREDIANLLKGNK